MKSMISTSTTIFFTMYNDSILPGHDFTFNENIIHLNRIFIDGSILPEDSYVIIECTLTKRYFEFSMERSFYTAEDMLFVFN